MSFVRPLAIFVQVFSGCVALLAGQVSAQCEPNEFAKFAAGEGSEQAQFGHSIAMEGDWALVGALWARSEGTASGGAYLFRRDGDEWVETQQLFPDDREGGDQVGFSVAINVDYAVVSALGDDDNGSDAGSVYVYRWSESAWVLDQKLLAPDGRGGHEFGRSVALAGDTLAIGAPDNGIGKTYVYQRTDSEWTLEATLRPLDENAYEQFGWAVAIEGDVLLIGAAKDDENGSHAGAAYVFQREGSTWTQTQKLLPIDGQPNRRFGYAVALFQDVIVVGPRSDDVRGSVAGAAYVFRRDAESGLWVEEAKLYGADIGQGDLFGRSISLEGDLLLVGASGSDNGGCPDPPCRSGAAYVFQYEADPGEWIERARIVTSDQVVGSNFGFALALTGDAALIGASWDNSRGFAFGSVYGFRGFASDCNSNGNRDFFDIATCSSHDCNRNNIPDECDLAEGRSEDADSNGILDECEGACCTPEDACVDDLPVYDCDGRFASETLCANLDPVCGSIGACCEMDGTCTDDVDVDACDGAFSPELDCDELELRCVERGACCRLDGVCVDEARIDECGGRFEIVTRCEDLEPPCEGFCLPTETADMRAFGRGEAVAMAGDLAIVGAPIDNENGRQAGAVDLHRFDVALREWVLEAELFPLDPIEEGEFGASVAVQDGTVFVGSNLGRGVRAPTPGAVYLFRKQDETWTQQQKLNPTDDVSGNSWFGYSLAVDGDVLAVGSPLDTTGPHAGAADVFRFDGNSWIRQVKLFPPSQNVRVEFGTSVALFGEVLVVGAPAERINGSGSGAAYVYRYDGTDWVEERTLLPDDPGDYDKFGVSVAVGEGTIIVGAWEDDLDNGVNAGSAYVFEYQGGVWQQAAKLVAIDGREGDRFGEAVALRDNMVVIGAIRNDGSGSAYVFQRDSGDWRFRAKLHASGGPAQFGTAIALADTGAIIGSLFSGAFVYRGLTSDCNENGTSDLCDITGGASEDCNGNDAPDECDIADGHSKDANENGVPDECEGACCLPGEGCSDSVRIEDCPGRFAPGVACKDIDPPCGTIGACCAPNGVCADGVSQVDCSDRFEPETGCADLDPPCLAFGACCEIGGTCSDAVRIDECDGRFVVEGTCVDLEPPCDEICEDEELLRLVDEQGEAGDLFGIAVAIEGDFALIGASGDKGDLGPNTGSVHAYQFDGLGWALQAQLFASDREPQDRFGAAVDIEGEIAVVGAFESAYGPGSAYVFRYDAVEREWIEQAKLLADDGEDDDWFGLAVSISQNRVLIGARNDGDNGGFSGSAYVFRFEEGLWQQEAKLLPHDGAAGDRFGWAVAIDGTRALVGARFDEDNGSSSGSVYVFEYDGEGWAETAKVKPADGRAGDGFGGALSLQGSTAAIGASGDKDSDAVAGSVYLFTFDGSQWREDVELYGPYGDWERFGNALDLSGDWLVVGTKAAASDRGVDSAHVFHFDGASWMQRFAWTPADPARDEASGIRVAIWEGITLTGSLYWGPVQERQGAAYLFGPVDCNLNGLEDACERMADGDFDADEDVDADDHGFFYECLAGPGVLPEPVNGACVRACLSTFDFDDDSDVDLADAAAFQLRFGG